MATVIVGQSPNTMAHACIVAKRIDTSIVESHSSKYLCLVTMTCLELGPETLHLVSFTRFIQHCQASVSLCFYDLCVNNKNSHKFGLVLCTIVLANGMVAAWVLDEAFARAVHLGWIPIHPTEDLTLLNDSDDSSTTMAMRRRESVRGVLQLHTDNRFPRSIGEFVVEDDVEGFSRTSADHVSGYWGVGDSTVTYTFVWLESILTMYLDVICLN